MAANFRVILMCLVFILVSNLIKPLDAFSAGGQFKLSFCSPMSFLDSVRIKYNAIDGCSEGMDSFNKSVFEDGNGFSGFFNPITINGEPVSAKEPKKNGYNIKKWITSNAYYEFLHLPQDA